MRRGYTYLKDSLNDFKVSFLITVSINGTKSAEDAESSSIQAFIIIIIIIILLSMHLLKRRVVT